MYLTRPQRLTRNARPAAYVAERLRAEQHCELSPAPVLFGNEWIAWLIAVVDLDGDDFPELREDLFQPRLHRREESQVDRRRADSFGSRSVYRFLDCPPCAPPSDDEKVTFFITVNRGPKQSLLKNC